MKYILCDAWFLLHDQMLTWTMPIPSTPTTMPLMATTAVKAATTMMMVVTTMTTTIDGGGDNKY